MERKGKDRTGQDRTGQDRTGQDRRIIEDSRREGEKAQKDKYRLWKMMEEKRA